MARLSFTLATIAAAAAFFGSAAAQGGAYAQCGGIGWAGATTCISGWCCVYGNAYYSQCLQTGCAAGTTTTAKPTSTTSTTSIKTTTTTTSMVTTTKGTVTTSTKTGVTTTASPTTTTSTVATGTYTSTAPITTLVPGGWVWLRSVEQPTFHTYVQSFHSYAPGDVIMGPYTSAAQFQIVSGQIEHYLPNGTFLYVNVRQPASSADVKLSMYFAATPNTFGTFGFQGDGVIWSTPTIARPNTGAFLVCPDPVEGNLLWINLGNYAYMTPAGCTDTTINYYNGATAVSR